MTPSLLLAATAGLLSGAPLAAAGVPIQPAASSTSFFGPETLGRLPISMADDAPAPAKHACKGQNACKGQGGCQASDMGCKGKNSCKGKGGCNTMGL
jgi:hypothetical protein